MATSVDHGGSGGGHQQQDTEDSTWSVQQGDYHLFMDIGNYPRRTSPFSSDESLS
jgi:hypothetical protein